jgi:hypothetical protein
MVLESIMDGTPESNPGREVGFDGSGDDMVDGRG